MSNQPRKWTYTGSNGEFKLEDPHLISYLAFPLVNEAGMMSSITPTLHGDIKTSHNSFLSEPVSAETLHTSRASRNFWVYAQNRGPWSAAGNSAVQHTRQFGTAGEVNADSTEQEKVTLEAGFLWQKLTRESAQMGLRAETVSFVPFTEDQVELMKVTLTNTGTEAVHLTPTAAIPLYGRSADNLRDHRHVTSLLHRIYTLNSGVEVQPTLSFDERGHRINQVSYSVLGREENGKTPVGLFPAAEGYVGEGGYYDWPRAVVLNEPAPCGAGELLEGLEAVGGLRFADVTLNPGESRTYILLMAITEGRIEERRFLDAYGSREQFDRLLEETKAFWQAKINTVQFQSADSDFDKWMKWVTLQPVLRRLLGNSFMPHHDYGRGGRGWRDLWQDCLALMIMEPEGVRELLYNNFAGVRMDGSNATIIGRLPGEFVADRNNIPRVWMDHGAWPFLTTLLYVNQSGDLDFLLQEQTYFKDSFVHRCKRQDDSWTPEEGSRQLTGSGQEYRGTILEHLLLQHLTPFYMAGEHNHMRLEGADWNDGLDMAADRGESVAFTAFYAGNLREMANVLRELKQRLGMAELALAEEMLILFDSLEAPIDYNSIEAKHKLINRYFTLVEHKVSGLKFKVDLLKLAEDLERKADWITHHIREEEWISAEDGTSWFNGYYNNDGQRVEVDHPKGVRMTLTGQVFPIMSGVATEQQVRQAAESVEKHLYDGTIGYRLNTRFGGIQQNLGRAFGFAFGHKENGAMFSHMTVMYANALYKRGFVKEGQKVLDSIYSLCANFEQSRIYPGIPEYINEQGRGMYPYLTGSASWMLLTLLMEVYGVKGRFGDLELSPKLAADQFDKAGCASVHTIFAGRQFRVIFHNPQGKEAGQYEITECIVDGKKVTYERVPGGIMLPRKLILSLASEEIHTLELTL